MNVPGLSATWVDVQREESRASAKAAIALGSTDSVARDVIKADDVVDFTQQETLADRVARKFGATMGRTLAASLGKAMNLR